MKLEVLLKTALMLLIIALAVVITSWVTSGHTEALAQGGGGSASGSWMMVSAEIQPGESLLYMFNADREVLLVYAFYRRAGVTRGARRYQGDLEFLAGRHCKWDLLYSQLRPYPYGAGRRVSSGVHMPAQLKEFFEKAGKAGK